MPDDPVTTPDPAPPTTTERAAEGARRSRPFRRRRWLAVATVLVAMLWTVLLETLPFGGVLGAAVITAVAMTAVALVVVARRYYDVRWQVGHDVWLAAPVLAVHLLVSYIAIPAATAVIPLVGRQANQLVFTATSDLPEWAVALVAALLVAPLEELWWRGTLQTVLRHGRSPWRAIGLTTAAFVAFHLPTFQLPLMGAALLGGIAWGWLRERTDGVLAPMLAHAGWTLGMVLAPPT
ncbi:CPBP family intramembrane glutamic endopeptidase [Salsipaludibacter albus]|uniref:CPBP family intramembrane glutamic endopeptidase n=1 Tax=Salsipaludibacter albus TaxID=2849650 RepID=UPI001EE46E23|nr:CPBP family intramembrane metalloprotease [Salsipaludibacter albus]